MAITESIYMHMFIYIKLCTIILKIQAMFLSFSFHGQSLKWKLLWAIAKLVKTKEHFLNTDVFLDQAAGNSVLYDRKETDFLGTHRRK